LRNDQARPQGLDPRGDGSGLSRMAQPQPCRKPSLSHHSLSGRGLTLHKFRNC